MIWPPDSPTRPVRYCTLCDLELPLKLKQIGFPTRPPRPEERSRATHVLYTRMAGGDMAQFGCEAHAFRWLGLPVFSKAGELPDPRESPHSDHYTRPIEEFWEDLDVKDAEARLSGSCTHVFVTAGAPNRRCASCGAYEADCYVVVTAKGGDLERLASEWNIVRTPGETDGDLRDRTVSAATRRRR